MFRGPPSTPGRDHYYDYDRQPSTTPAGPPPPDESHYPSSTPAGPPPGMTNERYTRLVKGALTLVGRLR